jgi:hypothetical protein
VLESGEEGCLLSRHLLELVGVVKLLTGYGRMKQHKNIQTKTIKIKLDFIKSTLNDDEEKEKL